MANTAAPNGFSQYTGTGSAPTYELVRAAISSSNTTPIFQGDPVVQATGTTGLGTGYITQATAPVAASITGAALSAGVLTFTFAALSAAPPVGGTIVVYGGTSTAATANGVFQIIASSTTTAAVNFSGAYTTGTASAYIFTPILGVFNGCAYLSTAQKKQVWANYAPGSDYNGDVTAYIINDPDAVFEVMTANSNTTSTAVGLASIGQTIGFNYSINGASPASTNGNTANGLSTYFADQYTLAANFPTGYSGQNFMPFKIRGLKNWAISGTSPFAGINGNDSSTAYNRILVGFNNSMINTLPGI